MRFRWSLGAWTSILILAIAAAVLATPAGARQRDEGGSFHHAVYLETNAPSGNTVVVFDRHVPPAEERLPLLSARVGLEELDPQRIVGIEQG